MGEKPKYTIEVPDLDLSELGFSRSKLDLLKINFEFEEFQKKKEQEILEKEQKVQKLKEELDNFSENFVKTRYFKNSEICIQENNFKKSLEENLEELISKYIYDILDIDSFDKKSDELAQLLGITELNSGSEEDRSYIGELRNIFRNEIPSYGETLSNSIISDLTTNNIDSKKITKIKIQKGVISIILENGKEIKNFEMIASDDKKGFTLKEPQIIDSKKRQEQKEKREDDLNLRHIGFPTIGLSLLFAGEIGIEYYKKSKLEELSFLDENGQEHKIRVSKEIEVNSEKEFIKKAIYQIKELTGYELNIDKNGKSFFESPESQKINVSEMIESIKKTFSFEDFKKTLDPNQKIDEVEAKKEFEKQKAENISFLRGIELQEGPLVKPSRFVRKLLVQSPKLMNLQHWILFPIFFKEMQKKPGNLDSYFKGAGEMATFTAGANTFIAGSKLLLKKELVKGLVDKSLRFLPGIAGTVTKYLFSTAVSVGGGMLGVGAGEYGAGLMKVGQKFDELFPEGEDIINKYLKKVTGTNKNSIDLNVLNPDGKYDEKLNIDLENYLSSVFSLGNKEIADNLKLDLSVPIFGKIWQHNLDLNTTDKQEYLSGSIFRDKKFYNEMVDKMGDNIVDELGLLIEEFKNPNKLTQKFNLNPITDLKDTKKLFIYNKGGEEAKKLLLENIKDLIYSGDEETNKSIKDTVYNVIFKNIDDIISGKTNVLELKVLTQSQIEKFKINDDFIEESKRELDIKKSMFEITFGLAKETPDKQKDEDGYINYSLANGQIEFYNQEEGAKNDETDNMFKYLKSLSPKEQEFAKNYFYRILNKEEVIQTEQKDEIWDAFNPKKVGLNDTLGFFSSIGQALKDSARVDYNFIKNPDKITFIDGENSDEAIYERLIKNPLFHKYTIWVKEYKNDLEFIEGLN